MVEKRFGIRIDKNTIKGEVKLFLNGENVAWRVWTPVKHTKEIIQHVPTHWESITGSALVSKNNGHVVHPDETITIDPVQNNILLVFYEDGQESFKDAIGQNKTLSVNQLNAENTSNQESAHAGFVKNDELVPTGYVGPLDRDSSWVPPNLTLRIVSDSVTGQTFDTIVKSTQPIHVWNLDDLTNTPDNSHWILYLDEHSTYQIKFEPSN